MSLGSRFAAIRLLAAAAGVLPFVIGCFFDTGIPLQNDVPRISPVARLQDTVTLYYPDSSVCTLSVADRNDSILTIDSSSWPGTSRQLSGGLGSKGVALYLPTNRLGELFKGDLIIVDQQQGRDQLPFALRKIFRDTFDISPAATRWTVWDDPGDTSSSILWTMFGLEFRFLSTGVSAGGASQLSLVSEFSFTGDFHWSVDYFLQEGLHDGFSLEFHTTTSRDTSRYPSGDDFVLALKGSSFFQISYVDLDGNTSIKPADKGYYSGTLDFERQDTLITVTQTPLNGAGRPVTDFPVFFPAADTVYVQLRMSETDHAIDRSCFFQHLWVHKGVFFCPPMH